MEGSAPSLKKKNRGKGRKAFIVQSRKRVKKGSWSAEAR
jgi:hypothetical protein